MANLDQTVYRRDVVPRPGFLNAWERHRHRKAHWFVEVFAESVSHLHRMLAIQVLTTCETAWSIPVYVCWSTYFLIVLSTRLILVCAGVGSTAAYVIGNLAGESGLSCQ